MKKILLVAIAMVFGSSAIASAQNPEDMECLKYLSYYKEYYKQKSYAEALPSWRKAYEICRPNIRETLYTEGTTLIREQIRLNAKNPIYKKQLVDTLMTLHQRRLENYPKSRVTTLNNIATDYIKYYGTEAKVIYEKCAPIIAELGVNSKPATLISLLKAEIDLYKAGEIETEVVLDAYDEYIGYIAKMEQTDLVTKIKSDMEELFISSKVAECEDLIRLFTPRYAAAKDDIVTVSKIVKMMGTAENCTDNELFYNAAMSMYTLDPSYTSAYYLYKLSAAKGNTAKAIKYIEEAVKFDESDDATDAQYYLEGAQYALKNGMHKKAIELATASVAKNRANNANVAKCYYVIATAWGSMACKGNEVEIRAHYWVAVDYLQKAKAADPSLAADCNEHIALYSKYFPNAADAFMYDVIDNQEYTVTTCEGLTATTTVRTNKQ